MRKREIVTYSETKAEGKLQSLLDHTAHRLCLVQNAVLSTVVSERNNSNLEIIYKWGFDGSSCHSNYNQTFLESTNSTDSDLLLTSAVLLKITTKH